MNKPQGEQFRRLSLEDLRRMYQAGTARPANAANLFPGTCYLCMRHFPAEEARIWKLLGAIRGTRILCKSCDAQARTPATAAAEEDGE